MAETDNPESPARESDTARQTINDPKSPSAKKYVGWRVLEPFVVGANTADGSIDFSTAGKAGLRWTARAQGAGMMWSLATLGDPGTIRRIRITLPFNPRMAATTVLPAKWLPPDGFDLPAVLSADGRRHDYWAPGILGLPIAYGLALEP